MFQFSLFFTIAVSGALFVSTAFRCKCTQLTNRDQEFKTASSVFLGEVVGILPLEGNPPSQRLLFRVEKSWKGVTGIRTQIKVGTVLTCGYQFQKGKTYLVFASDQPPHFTAYCSSTKLAEKASEDIAALGSSIPFK